MWEYSPKTVKKINFGHKLAAQKRLVCTIFRNFQRLYASIGTVAFKFLIWSLLGTNNQVISIFTQSGHFPTNFQLCADLELPPQAKFCNNRLRGFITTIPYFDDFGGLQPTFLNPRCWNFGATGRTWTSLPTPNFGKKSFNGIRPLGANFTKNSRFLWFWAT